LTDTVAPNQNKRDQNKHRGSAAVADYESLLYEEKDGVATITLNRPDKHNSFSPTLINETEDVWKKLRFNNDVRAVIITGAGDKAFSTGIDLSQPHPQPESKLIINDPMLRIGPKTNDLWKPVIAAVNGMACGGAFYILGEVEFIIASDNATFFDPHVTHGMPCVYEPMYMLQRMPIGEIMRLSLLGRYERMTAERAREIGLVQEVVPQAELLEKAQWAARVIADSPDPMAIESTVKAIWTAQYMGIHQALQSAPVLINVVDGTRMIAERADALRRQKIEPRLR
jgi:enoyl-CoA hydratase/carnithine racemase